MEKVPKKIARLFGFAIGVLFFMIVSVKSAQAATLYFDPAAGSRAVGETFSVQVDVSSTDQAMNAVQGTIAFPNDKLEVESLSTNGSIISIWVREPSFQNNRGTIQFEGVVLNPGFTGVGGKVLTLNFKAKETGNATISFATGTVLANDGKGTNIVEGLSTATYSLSVPSAVPPGPESTTPVETPGVPAAPIISSTTHPDPNAWYAANVASLSWTVSSDATAASYAVDHIPNTNPITSAGLRSSYTAGPLSDGTWYFHVRLKNTFGWGSIAHYRLQIDSTKPDRFEITEIPQEDETDPILSFRFEAHDATSGIDHYEIRVNQGTISTWIDDGSHLYRSEPMSPGDHIMILRAVDKAGNFQSNFAEAHVVALPAPVITEYPRTLRSDEALTVKGTTFPGAHVTFWVRKGDTGKPDFEVGDADADGMFTVVYGQTLDKAVYQIWVTATDTRGAQADPSETKKVVVEVSAVEEIGNIAIRFLVIVTILLVLLVVSGWLLWFIFKKAAMLKRVLFKEEKDSEQHVRRTYEVLRRDKSLAQLQRDVKALEDEFRKEVKEAKSKTDPKHAKEEES